MREESKDSSSGRAAHSDDVRSFRSYRRRVHFLAQVAELANLDVNDPQPLDGVSVAALVSDGVGRSPTGGLVGDPCLGGAAVGV